MTMTEEDLRRALDSVPRTWALSAVLAQALRDDDCEHEGAE